MRWTRIAVLFSLANILFLPAWMGIFPSSSYFVETSTGFSAYLALVANVSSITLGLHYIMRYFEVNQSAPLSIIRRLILFSIATIAINSVRVGFQDQFYVLNLANQVLQIGWTKFLLLYLPPFLVLGFCISRWETNTRRLGSRILLLFSFLPAVLSWSLFKEMHNIAANVSTSQGLVKAGAVRRNAPTILMIFDEWDYSWSFPFRPKHIKMPEIDRLKEESVFFTRAYPPTDQTFKSIPSLLTGQVVTDARTTPGPDVALHFMDKKGWQTWSEVPDLAYTLGQQGLRTCFITHFHRFGPSYMKTRPLLEIKRTPYFQEWVEGENHHGSFFRSLASQWTEVLGNIPGVNYLLRHESKDKSVPKVYQQAMQNTLSAIRSRNYDVIIVHWPIPHAPAIVNPADGQFVAVPIKGVRIIENLSLVDKTVGVVRKELEGLGLWADTMLILTSDHWQRYAADPAQGLTPNEPGVPNAQKRVPLIIKMPGSDAGQVISSPVGNVLVTPLIESANPEEELSLLVPKTQIGGAYSPWIK